MNVDLPATGDEVLYHHLDGRWSPATVLGVAIQGGLQLDIGNGPDLPAVNVKHGPHRRGWLLYREAAGAVAGAAPTQPTEGTTT